MFDSKGRNMLITDNTIYFKNQNIDFPVDYKIKIIMDATNSDENNRNEIKKVFEKLEIPNRDWSTRLSSSGRYISFTIQIHVKDQKLFDRLYNQLNFLDNLKWAV